MLIYDYYIIIIFLLDKLSAKAMTTGCDPEISIPEDTDGLSDEILLTAADEVDSVSPAVHLPQSRPATTKPQPEVKQVAEHKGRK